MNTFTLYLLYSVIAPISPLPFVFLIEFVQENVHHTCHWPLSMSVRWHFPHWVVHSWEVSLVNKRRSWVKPPKATWLNLRYERFRFSVHKCSVCFSILYYLISKSLWVSAVSYNTSNVTIIILIWIKYTALCVHHHLLSYQRIVRNCGAAVNIRRLFVNLTELNWLSSSLNSLLSHMDNSFFFFLYFLGLRLHHNKSFSNITHTRPDSCERTRTSCPAVFRWLKISTGVPGTQLPIQLGVLISLMSELHHKDAGRPPEFVRKVSNCGKTIIMRCFFLSIKGLDLCLPPLEQTSLFSDAAFAGFPLCALSLWGMNGLLGTRWLYRCQSEGKVKVRGTIRG